MSRNIVPLTYTPVILLACLVMGLWIAGFIYSENNPNPGIVTGEYCKDECIFSDKSMPCPQSAAQLETNNKLTAKEVLGMKLKDYQADRATLSTNLFLQLAFILLALLVVTGTSDVMETPVAGIKLPRRWLYYFVPVGMAYFWLEFGFLTDKMIQNRQESWGLLQILASDPGTLLAEETRVEADHLTQSLARLFEDGAYVDGWFVAFRGCEHVINTSFRWGTNIFWAIVFGSILGMTHAGAIFMAHIGNARYFANTKGVSKLSSKNTKLLKRIAKSLPFAIIALILLSHIQFYFGGKNPNWLQVVIGLAAVLFSYILIKIANNASSDIVDKPDTGDQNPESDAR